MPGSLEGLKVIDLTSHLSGPYCAMVLADQGADVIKVERTGQGDDARNMPPFVNGQSAPFMLWNRNKRSVELDLKTDDGLRQCLELVQSADVFIENFKPGVAERLGLGYDALHEHNPALIYCSISGYGQTGPYSERGGFDLIMQGLSGLMAVNGPAEGEPFRLPIAISDVTAGLFGAVGILSALAAREKLGVGQQVDVSLLDSAISHGVYEAAGYFASNERPARLGQAHRGGSPYQMVETADRAIIFGASPQHLWRRFCEIVECEELMDDQRFKENADRVQHNTELMTLLQPKLRAKPSSYWLEALYAAGIPAGPVLSHDETFADPQVVAREMVVEVTHPTAGATRTLGTPVKLSGTPGGIFRPAPDLGQHNDEVLSSLAGQSKSSVNVGKG